MDKAGGRIPAWQRLGLKLKNSAQPEANPLNGTDVAEQQHGNGTRESTVAAQVNSSPGTSIQPRFSKLGKRKHQDEPAEVDNTSLKKSKVIHEHLHGDGHAVCADLSTTKREKRVSDDKPRRKGDPNYRKKKGKQQDPSSRKTESRQDQLTAHPHELASLSPGEADPASKGTPLVVSIEVHRSTTPPATTLTEKEFPVKPIMSSRPPQSDRRKSVTFTPDTKTADGSSTSNLFKKWVQEQKGGLGQFSAAEVAQFVPPAKVHPANHIQPTDSGGDGGMPAKASTKSKLNLGHPQEGNKLASVPAPNSLEGKKKDPDRYISYLTQYYTDRKNWKFNKAKQNDLLDNSLNVFRIPEEHSEALVAYVKGLQGAGVIERLKQRCEATIAELDAEEGKPLRNMDDPETRKAAEEEALQEHLRKQKKRRQLDADIENMIGHPHSEGYIRRLKRRRAEALLKALNLAAPALSHRRNGDSGHLIIMSKTARSQSPQKIPRKRKSRTEVSSDESSSSSSSSEENSSSSESEPETGSGSESDSESSDSTTDASSQEDRSDGSNETTTSGLESEDDGSSSSEDSSEGSSSQDSN